ncbi:MAG: hypothetical protein IKW10_03160 [Oscillospiraceae bacterium]|nr:hypothetical protein [Oscillospiraceae bacterium]
MKKNLLSLLLAVVLVLGLMIVATPAMATEEETTPAEPAAHSHCVCVRSEAKPADHVCDETIVWEPYVKGMTLVDGGHYYLTANTGETRNLTGSGTKKLNITICLNGFTFRSNTPFKVQNGNTLTICDCQGGGAIRSSKADGTGYSVWAGYNKGVVNLYSGILSGLISAGYNARPVVVDGGTFNMYGGTIKNGDSGTITTGSPNVGYGGNVLVKSYQGSATHVGTFNLFGGTIEGGKATADGGNIYVLGGALNIYGGIIKDGSAVNGGNIAANGSYIKDDQSANRRVDLTISGGTVQNGVATEKGGNIYLQNTTNGCVFAMSDNALVTGGKAAMGGNIASYQTNPTTGLKGGTISNGVATSKGGNIYVESSADKANTFTLDGTTVTGGLAKLVEIGVDAEGNPTETITWGNGGNIYVDSGSNLNLKSGTVTLGEANDGGNIYIAADVTTEGFAIQVTDGVAHNNGGNLYVHSDLSIGAITISGGKANVNGGNIFADAIDLTLEGTTLSGGTANNGGNISMRNTGAQLLATDVIIENGVAIGAGGNIYTYNVPTVKFTGGSITGGAANNGGNIYSTHSSMTATRRLTISGTTVANGTAETNGGNLYIAKVGVVKLENVTCDNGQANKNGGNVYMEGNYKINFVGGTYSVAQGGRLYETTTGDDAYKAMVAQYGRNVGDTKLISEGGKRMDGNGGNICIAWGNDKVDEVKEGDVVVSTERTPNEASFNGTTLIGGNAVNGGALYIGNANATIENVTAKTCGGANGRVLHVAKNGVVTVKDSTFVNWGTQGTTIHNHGSLSLVGAVKLDKEFNGNERYNGTAALTNGIILDVTENADAMVDISALTEVANREEEGLPTVSGIAMTRYASIGLNTDKEEIKLTGAGKLAAGVNDTNRGFIYMNSTGYVLTEREGDLYADNAAIQGFNANHDVTCGGADLTAISAEAKSGVSYYTVNADLENAGVLSIDAVLNLNGKTVANATVAEGVTLYLADGANKLYDASKCGKFSGEINGIMEYITHTVIGSDTLHFVTLQNEDGSYSAHRYMARIAAVSLDAKKDALGYKAVFDGDEVVQSAVVSRGFHMWVDENCVSTRTSAGFDKGMTLRLHSIMANNGGEMTIYGEAFLILNIDGQEVEATTSARTTTMKSTIKEVNELTDLNDDQKSAVYGLYAQYADIMSAWLGETNNIKDWAPVEATA